MKRDIIRLFVTNIIKMSVTLLTAFVVPIVLSVNDYGYLKLYQFYVSYIGVSHLGYCDGIYLYYGGMDINSIDRIQLSLEHNTLLLYEIFVACCFLLYSIVNRDFIILVLAFTIVPAVLSTLYIYIYQATGELKIYSKLVNFTTICNLIIITGLVFASIKNYKFYIVANCFVQWIMFAAGWISFQRRIIMGKIRFSVKVFIKYVQMGVLLTIGNFIYALFIGIDKWFINKNLDISQFSFYSFAAQMVTVVNMIVSPIAMTLYSHLSREKNKNFEIRIKRLLVVILMLIPLSINCIELIVCNFLSSYIPAVDVIRILLVSQLFLVLNTTVFVNLFKVYKKQKDYFIRLCIAVVVALLLNILICIYSPNIVAFSIATMFSMIVWLLLNLNYFYYLKPEMKELIYMVGLLLLYAFLLKTDIIVRIAAYFTIYLLATKYLMREEWNYLFSQIQEIYIKIRKIFVNKKRRLMK